MSKKYKNVSIWYNGQGVDECYWDKDNTQFDNKFLEEACIEAVDFIEGVKRSDFSIESKGKDWVMYEFDGFGILCITSKRDKEACHYEYSVKEGYVEEDWQ